jgi:hypothetical protein
MTRGGQLAFGQAAVALTLLLLALATGELVALPAANS